jgi:hypothetical protein
MPDVMVETCGLLSIMPCITDSVPNHLTHTLEQTIHAKHHHAPKLLSISHLITTSPLDPHLPLKLLTMSNPYLLPLVPIGHGKSMEEVSYQLGNVQHNSITVSYLLDIPVLIG